MKSSSTRRLCRAGVIAALYVALTYAFMPFAFGPIQIRPAEALCILPLFYFEAIPALWVGCMLSNLASPYLFYDVVIGSLATLFAAFGSYMVGLFLKKDTFKLTLGGIFPILLNAFVIPLILVFLYNDGQNATWMLYWTYALSIGVTETIWVYGLGFPLYIAVKRLRKKSIRFLID